jgi:hypothetical protein
MHYAETKTAHAGRHTVLCIVRYFPCLSMQRWRVADYSGGLLMPIGDLYTKAAVERSGCEAVNCMLFPAMSEIA